MAMLSESPRSATALAKENVLLFSVDRKALTARMPLLSFRIVVNIAKQLCEKLQGANALIPTTDMPTELQVLNLLENPEKVDGES